jgi:hypothetical protein
MKKLALTFMAVLPGFPATAATVNIGVLETSFAITQLPPRIPSISVDTSVTVDLSSLSGLTPGSDIAITFTSDDDLIWLGGFGADAGDLTLLCHARLTLTAGAYTTFSDETWSFGPVPWTEDLNPQDLITFSDPVGYITGPTPKSFTLTVPWGTDLSAVTFTLTDLFSVSGVNPYITQSGVYMASATLNTTSIPEPTALLLSLAGLGSLLVRRRVVARI